MKNTIRHLTVALTFLIILSLPVFAQNAAKVSVEGNWLSTLEYNGIKLRLVLKVAKSASGLTAKLDSIDQGANDLRLTQSVSKAAPFVLKRTNTV